MTTFNHTRCLSAILLCTSLHALLICVAPTALTANAADVVPGTRLQAASPADGIVGVWKPADMDVDIQIYNANGQYVGAVVKAANPAMMNAGMLRGITFDPATNTWRGEVFAVKRGSFVPMSMKLTAGGFEMVAGSGVMSKTIEWVRIQ